MWGGLVRVRRASASAGCRGRVQVCGPSMCHSGESLCTRAVSVRMSRTLFAHHVRMLVCSVRMGKTVNCLLPARDEA